MAENSRKIWCRTIFHRRSANKSGRTAGVLKPDLAGFVGLPRYPPDAGGSENHQIWLRGLSSDNDFGGLKLYGTGHRISGRTRSPGAIVGSRMDRRQCQYWGNGECARHRPLGDEGETIPLFALEIAMPNVNLSRMTVELACTRFRRHRVRCF